jgi:CRP-like cAMP-binding protein
LYASTLNNLGLKYASQRLCYRLLVLASRFGQKKGKTTTIPYISHSDLASSISLAREVVSREISRLEKLGVIEYGRSGILVKDSKHLQDEIGKDVSIIFFDNF